MTPIISVEQISKFYRLGIIGAGTFADDLRMWWARTRGKPNPLLRIGAADLTDRAGEEIWAIRDISFTVEKGEALGIIGRNGAGKSTLLKILARVTAPTSGVVKIKGRIASLLEVGTGFHPDLTGRENIYLNGAILGMSKAEVNRKFDEIIDFSGVEQFIETPVKRYSSGMYIRLAFAVGAFLDPEILVVDEVLSVGDAEFQRRCLGKMGDVAREGRTVLFVSHNMAAVQNLCPNSMLIEEGKKKIIGPTDTVIAKYLEQADIVAEGDVSGVSYNRGGDGSVRFVHWSVEDEKYGRGFQVGCNHSCRFYVSYHILTSIRQKKFSVSISIRDTFGQAILTGSTTYSNTDFFDVKEDGVIVCEFPQMPLVPGTYIVYLWCSVNGETADLISNAGSLTVVPSDFFGTGKLPNKRHGFFVVENHWQLEKS